MNTTVVGGWSEGVIGEYLNLSPSIYYTTRRWGRGINSTTAFMYVVIYIYYYIYIYISSTYCLYDLDKYVYYDVLCKQEISILYRSGISTHTPVGEKSYGYMAFFMIVRTSILPIPGHYLY